MDRVDFTFKVSLPQELAEQAEAAGLLTKDEFENWLMRELGRRQQIERLKAIEPPITPEEIQAEIDAYRQEKRQRKAVDQA